ncbi:MAG: portal protein [Pirellulales bacterium]
MAKRGSADDLVEREKTLRGARGMWEVQWQSIARYCLPNSATFMEQVTPGQERMRYILDSTAPRALEMFASFLHTLLNSPASQWIKFGVEGEPDLTNDAAVREYLETCQVKVMNILVSPSADIYSQLHQIYLDLGAFGTGVMYVDNVARQLRTRVYHLDDCVIDEGEDEMIDSVFRQRKQTRRAALQRFKPEKLGRNFVTDETKDMNRVDRYLHCVIPATDALAETIPLTTRQKLSRPQYVSAWILDEGEGDKKILETGTYQEFPYMVPRWYKARGEVYGRSQAMTAMPDIRMVNRMSDTILRGAEKIVDPPLVIRDGSLMSPVRLHAGGLTFVEGDTEIKSLIPPGTSRIETGNQLLIARQQAIKEAFFTPLFVTPDSPVKTATQVMQEVDERNRALSPMLVRLQTELFSRLCVRVFNLLRRAGHLPTPPVSLRDKTLNLEYVSPLIASQKQMEALAIARSFEQLSYWAQVDRGIFDWVDTDEVAQRVPMANGMPANMLKTATAVKDVRKARAEKEAQDAMLQQGPEAAKGAAALISAGADVTKANAAANG